MNKTLRIVFLCALIVLLLAAVCLLLFDPFGWRAEEKPADDPQLPVSVDGFTALNVQGTGKLNDDVELTAIGTYTGAYVEDGTDDPITDVLAVLVKNTGEKWIEYIQLSVLCGEETVYFECTALPANSYALVLADQRICYDAQAQISNVTCTSPAFVTNAVLDFSGEFELYPDNGVINIKNISGRDISGDVSVYYKNFSGDVYLGGIAYRVRVEGGIAAEEIVQRLEDHYSNDASVILFMSYEK